MIKALAPLGKANDVTISLAYDGTDVTATVIIKPKQEGAAAIPIQFSGPIEEVEAAIAKDLPGASIKVAVSQSNLAELDEQLKATEDKAKEKAVNKVNGPEPKKIEPAKGKTGAKAKPAAAKEKPADDTPTKGATPATDLLDDL